MTDDATPTPPAKMGRSTYTPEIGLAICQRLAAGESLRSICESPGMPDRSTVFTWLYRGGDFRAMHDAAREIGAEAMGDEIVDISKTAKSEDANLVRVRLEVTKWAAAVYAPKKFGNRQAVEHSGPDGRPVQLQAVPLPMVPTQVAQAVRDLIGKAEADMGLPAGDGTDQERLQRLLASDQPLTPDVYESIHGGKK